MEVAITDAMLAGITPDVFYEAEPLLRLALLNGLAARIGLCAWLGEEAGFQLYEGGLDAILSGTFDGSFTVNGKRAVFKGLIESDGHASGLAIDHEPDPDTVYVLVCVDPMLSHAELGWIRGRDVLSYGTVR